MTDAATGGGGDAGAGAGGAGGGDKGKSGGAQGGGAGGGAGGAGGGDKPFYSDWGLDDTHRDFVVGKGFKSPADLAKSAALADKLVRDRNVVPAPDMAKIGEWEGWEKLGWSKDLGHYKLPDAKVPDGLQYDKAMEGRLVEAMHAAKLPPHQAAAVRDGLIGILKAETDARDARGRAESEGLQTALKQEWGAEFQAKSDVAARAARALGLDLSTSAQLEKFTGAPGMLKLFAKIGETMGEDVLRGGSARAESAMSSDAASAEQRRLAADPDFMRSLNDSRHPTHKDNAARWLKLQEAKAGGRR